MSLSKSDSSDDSLRSVPSSYMGDGPENTSKIGEIVNKNASLPVMIKRETMYSKHATDRFRRIESFFNHNQLTDVTLIAGDKIIHAHRMILSASSDYFAAMFMNNLRESNEREIKFPEMDGEILRRLVNFCYTGIIDMHEDTVESILTSSSILQLNEVTDKCCSFMAKQLHPSNCIGIYLFADRQGCQILKEDAYYYITRYFMDVIQNQEYLDTPEDEVCKLLSSDDLNVPSEDEIFQALMKWVEYNVVERTRNIGKLLALVRLPLLQPSFIVDHIQTKAILRDDPTCQVLIMEALNYHLLPERRPQLQNSRTHPRKSTVGTLLAIGGMDSYKGAVSIEEFDNRLCQWYQVGNMSGRRLQFGAAVINNKLFVVGGRDGLKTLNTAECLDLKTMIWSNLPTMSTSRHGLGVAVLGGPLYAIGGHDGWSYLNSVERWDSDLRQWSYVAPMSFARSTASVAVLNNKIYAVGGRDGSSCLKFVEMYDPHTNKWSLCSPMIKKRGAVGVGVLNGYLYAVGGHDAPANNPSAARFECVERYDPTTDSWSIIANMSLGRDSVGVCVLGDQLFAVGGYDGQSYLSLVETYDPITNEWKKCAPLSIGRAGACVVAIKSRIVTPEY